MAATDLSADERERFIASEVGGDEALRREVHWMIEAMERSDVPAASLLVGPAVDLSGGDAEAAVPSHYRVLRHLGAGGMGVVYLAERDSGGYVQNVALKMLSASAEGSPILLERFSRERQLLARLDHPGIARLLDGGLLSNGKPFIAMDYVDGERIDLWCDRQQLDLRSRILLFLKVCDAVAYAHRSLVIHRDIKPDNILVTSTGEPKLLDFGIARLVDDTPVEPLTETGQHAMSLSYASPEQVACRPLTTTTDVYSLGAVLYRLVSGCAPFAGNRTPVALMNAILGNEVLAPGRRKDGSTGHGSMRVPADIDAIVLKALRKSPTERYESVAALVADLRCHLVDRPVSARRGQRLYRAERFIRRHRWQLLVAGIFIAVGAGFVVNRARYIHQVETERNRAQALSGFMTSLLANAAPAQAQGKDVSVRDVLDRGVAGLMKRTDIDPMIKGDLLNTMGESYISLHLWRESRVALLAANKIFADASAPIEDRAKVIGNLALAANALGENAHGIALSREGQQLLATDRDRHFKSWANLRLMELDNLNNENAVAPDTLIAPLRELIAACERRNDPSLHTQLAQSYMTLAAVQQRKGDLEAALKSMRLVLDKAYFDQEDPENQLTARSNYARLLVLHGNLAESVKQLQLLDRDYVRLVGPQTMERAMQLNNLSVALAQLGRDAEGLDASQKAVAIARAASGDDNRFFLQLAVGYAMNLQKAKRYDVAEKQLAEVLPILKAQAGPGNGNIVYAYALNVLAMLQLNARHDPHAALSTLRQSRQLLGDRVGEFLVIADATERYLLRALLALHKPKEAAEELDSYQAVLDQRHEPVDSKWRKKLAVMRGTLAAYGESAGSSH